MESAGGKADGKKGADLRNISQIKRARLAEGLAVEGESEKKEGVKDDSYIAGTSIRASGGPVVPLNWGSLGGKCVGRRRSV